jgi:dual oxidase
MLFFLLLDSGFVFGGLDFNRRDLMAVNIQRGRDHGLPDYNTAREAYGLERKTKFIDIKANESYIPDDVRGKILKNFRNIPNTNLQDLFFAFF